MKTRRKAFYESPTTQVVELRVIHSICNGSSTAIWTLENDAFSSFFGWDRSGYGEASEI